MDEQDKLPMESDPQPETVSSNAEGSEISESMPDVEKEATHVTPPDLEAPEVFVPEEALAPTKSKGERFMAFVRRMITWVLVFLLVYLAGVVTIYILEYQPTKDALEQVQLDLDQANATIADQQVELDQAYFNLSYNAYLEVLADVYAARLALELDDTLGAKAALATTDEQLELILEDVAEFDQALAESLPQRLSLIITNIDADIERSISDADFFTEDLLKVYQGVYYQN
jgi:hypothetical protein